jgi:hypothetical protein
VGCSSAPAALRLARTMVASTSQRSWPKRPRCSRSSSREVRILAPGAIAAPASEAAVDRFPRAVGFGDVSPGGTGVQTPEDAIEDAVMVFPRTAAAGVVSRGGEEPRDALPVAIGKFMAVAHDRPSEENLLLGKVVSAVM